MSLRQIKVNGRKVWPARVSFKGARRSTIRDSKADARDAEAELLRQLRHRACVAGGDRPAAVCEAFEIYLKDLEVRGKSPDSIARAGETFRVVERLAPELLGRAIDQVKDTDIFAFRQKRHGRAPSRARSTAICARSARC